MNAKDAHIEDAVHHAEAMELARLITRAELAWLLRQRRLLKHRKGVSNG